MTNANSLTKVVIDITNDVIASENAILQELGRAADAGDLPRVRELLNRWLKMPVVDVLIAKRNIADSTDGKTKKRNKRDAGSD